VNPLDIFIIVVLAFCLIRGIFRGLIKEVSAIIGVFAGFYMAFTYYPVLSKLLARWISETAYQNIFSFLVIFSLVFILVSVLGIIIKYVLKIAFLGWMDRICGAGFGFVKGILIVSVVLISLTAFLKKGTPVIRDSLLAPHVTLVSENMVKIVPKDMKQAFTNKLEELKKAWNGR
jgi:membrane protein required for colicin V production